MEPPPARGLLLIRLHLRVSLLVCLLGGAGHLLVPAELATQQTDQDRDCDARDNHTSVTEAPPPDTLHGHHNKVPTTRIGPPHTPGDDGAIPGGRVPVPDGRPPHLNGVAHERPGGLISRLPGNAPGSRFNRSRIPLRPMRPPVLNFDDIHQDEKVEDPFLTLREFQDDFFLHVVALYVRVCRQSCAKIKIKGQGPGRNRLCNPCYCDRHCWSYGDCCPDLLLLGDVTGQVINASRPDVALPPPRLGNFSTRPEGEDFETTLQFYREKLPKPPEDVQPCRNPYLLPQNPLIRSCSHDNPTRDLCEDGWTNSLYWSHRDPVSNVASGHHYRNRDCANCNNDTEAVLWRAVVRCLLVPKQYESTMEFLTEAVDNLDCSVRLLSPALGQSPRLCVSADAEENLCRRFQRDINLQVACGLFVAKFGKHTNPLCSFCAIIQDKWYYLTTETSATFESTAVSSIYAFVVDVAAGMVSSLPVSNSNIHTRLLYEVLQEAEMQRTKTADEYTTTVERYYGEKCGLRCSQTRDGGGQASSWTGGCPLCFCDSMCLFYGDCCPDFNRTLVSSDVIPCRQIKVLDQLLETSCPPDQLALSLDCLLSARSDLTLDDLERDLHARLPVSHLQSRRNFRSHACAECNGVTEDLVYWRPVVRCAGEMEVSADLNSSRASKEVLREALLRPDCSLTFVSPLTSNRESLCWRPAPNPYCRSTEEQARPGSVVEPTSVPANLKTLCQCGLVAPVADETGTIHTNVFCSLCADDKRLERTLVQNAALRDRALGTLSTVHWYELDVSGLQANLTDHGLTWSGLQGVCSPQQRPDPYRMRCRDVHCLRGEPEGNQCVATSPRFHSDNFLCLDLLGAPSDDNSPSTPLDRLPLVLHEVLPPSDKWPAQLCYTPQPEQDPTTSADVAATLVVWTSQSNKSRILEQLQQSAGLSLSDGRRVQLQQRECGEVDLLQEGDSPGCEGELSPLMPGAIDLAMSSLRNTSLSDCLLVNVTAPDEFIMDTSDGSLVLKGSGRRLTSDLFFLSRDNLSALVCYDDFLTPDDVTFDDIANVSFVLDADVTDDDSAQASRARNSVPSLVVGVLGGLAAALLVTWPENP